MTINDLIERLEELRGELGGDVEVRLMTQPNWPFEYKLAGVTCLRDINYRQEADGDGDDETPPAKFAADGGADEVVYLLEGRQLGYGTQTAWFFSE